MAQERTVSIINEQSRTVPGLIDLYGVKLSPRVIASSTVLSLARDREKEWRSSHQSADSRKIYWRGQYLVEPQAAEAAAAVPSTTVVRPPIASAVCKIIILTLCHGFVSVVVVVFGALGEEELIANRTRD